MAPCFAGADLRIVRNDAFPGPVGLRDAEAVDTHGWHPLSWGRELMRRDVGLLLCAGIDQGTWSSIKGHGIEVIPNAMGVAGVVFNAWRRGQLAPPRIWPAYPVGWGRLPGGGMGRGRRRRFRGGSG
jgi:hypothetical protein